MLGGCLPLRYHTHVIPAQAEIHIHNVYIPSWQGVQPWLLPRAATLRIKRYQPLNFLLLFCRSGGSRSFSSLRAFSAVLGARLHTFGNTLRIKCTTDNMITDAR